SGSGGWATATDAARTARPSRRPPGRSAQFMGNGPPYVWINAGADPTGTRSRLAGVEVGLEDRGDSVAAFLRVGGAGVVDAGASGLEHLADPAGHLLEVEAGQGPGVGRELRVAAPDEDHVDVRVGGARRRGVAQDHPAQPSQVLALEVASDDRESAL